MSRDAHWVQREMRAMSDADRDAYIKRSRRMYDTTMAQRAIYAKYKPVLDLILEQRQQELDLLQDSDDNG